MFYTFYCSFAFIAYVNFYCYIRVFCCLSQRIVPHQDYLGTGLFIMILLWQNRDHEMQVNFKTIFNNCFTCTIMINASCNSSVASCLIFIQITLCHNKRTVIMKCFWYSCFFISCASALIFYDLKLWTCHLPQVDEYFLILTPPLLNIFC